MERTQLTYADHNIFLIKMLIWLGFAGLGFLMALIGLFYPLVAWGAFLIATFFFIRFATGHNIFSCISREFWVMGVLFIFVSFGFSFFATPSVFSGRDQGSISQAAIRLSQNHKLEFSTPASQAFFLLRGAGKALNFPGFYYTSNGTMITQFPILYTAWLAMFFAVFGIYGFVLANMVLFAIFLMTFYMLLRFFVSKRFAILGTTFAITSFGIFWFTKITLSENMALPLVWIAVFSLVLFWKEQKNLYLTSLLFSLILLCFARIEGFALLATMIIIVFWRKDMREFILKDMTKRFCLPLFILLGILALDLWVNFPFFKEIGKALFPTITLPKAQLLGTMKNITLPSWYFIKVYALYGILGFVFFSIFGIIISLKKGITERVAPFLLIAPTLVYFYDSHITPDHPWMLRRLMFSLLPAAIFYTTLMLSKVHFHYRKNRLTVPAIFAVATFLIAMNMPAFLNFATYSENKGLLTQVGNLSQKFQPGSLVLVDQEVSGDGWDMIDEPLSTIFGVQSAYFFATQDLAKLNLAPFEKVYLLVPQKNALYYEESTIGKRLTPVSNFTLNIKKLSGSSDNPFQKIELPQKTEHEAEISIFQISKQ